MSDKSLNGWPVIHPGDGGLVTQVIPGTSVRVTLNKHAAPLLLHVASRVHREVASITANNGGGQDDAGYNFRQARNANAFSNHASGTAVDLNWREWPQSGANRSMTTAETVAARKIASDVSEVVAWGGNWTRLVDEMHWEVKPGVTPADVKAYCAAHGIQEDGTVDRPAVLPIPTGKPVVPAEPARLTVNVNHVQPGVSNIEVRLVKRALSAEKLFGGLVFTNKFGPRMERAYAAWQRRCGVPATGTPDKKSLRMLGIKHGFEVK